MPAMTLCAVVPSPPYATSIIAPSPPHEVPPPVPLRPDKSNKSRKANVHWNVTSSDMPNTVKRIVITKQKNPNISTVANAHWGQVRLVGSSRIPSLTGSRVDSLCLYLSFFWSIEVLYFHMGTINTMIVAIAMMVVIRY